MGEAVSFVDANTGTAVGDSTILRTTDGGVTWTPQDPGTLYPTAFYAVSFADANHGMALGFEETCDSPCALVMRTTDGGATWTMSLGTYLIQLSGLSVSGANTATVVGSADDYSCSCGGYGLILRTTDGGATWSLQDSGQSWGLTAVSFVDANIGTVIGGGGAILRTNTGGR
jgi:photosystem II stability/assembly factor-like uncharacterized protein